MDKTDGRIVRVEAWVVFQMPRQGIDQCATEVAATWVYDQPCGFVHYQQVFVFVNYIEWYVFGNNLPFALRAVEHQSDDVARLYLVIAFDGLSVDLYEACIGGFLYAVATGVA